MNSTPNPKQADPHDAAIAALKKACEQVGGADAQPEPDAAGDPWDQQKRAAVLLRRSSPGRLAAWCLIGLAVVAGLSIAAFAWQSYGDAIIARWASERVSTSSLSQVKLEPPPKPPTVDVTTADGALPQRAPLAQTTPQDLPPIAPELAQWLQETTRYLTDVEQGIKELKTSQEQMLRDNAELAERLKATQAQIVRDNAAVGEQLKTALTQIAHDNAAVAKQLKESQEQMARVIAKASEENVRPKISPPPRRPTVTPRRKPVPTPPSQAGAQPLAPKPEQQ
jgi:gas vesicle protein